MVYNWHCFGSSHQTKLQIGEQVALHYLKKRKKMCNNNRLRKAELYILYYILSDSARAHAQRLNLYTYIFIYNIAHTHL